MSFQTQDFCSSSERKGRYF